jgi:hypothetical protein
LFIKRGAEHGAARIVQLIDNKTKTVVKEFGTATEAGTYYGVTRVSINSWIKKSKIIDGNLRLCYREGGFEIIARPYRLGRSLNRK